MPAGTDFLSRDESLYSGQRLISPNHHFRLDYQGDGNLVLYREWDGRARWASNTNGRPAGRCIMQSDGNLVMYDSRSGGRPVWSSRTNGKPGSVLYLQDDGNLVIKQAGTVIWQTNTVQGAYPTGARAVQPDMQPDEVLYAGDRLNSIGDAYRLHYQSDGNLVLYRNETSNAAQQALWASGTNGRPCGWVVMQPDGNLVIYDPNGKSLWASNTFVGGSHLVVQSDGSVAIINQNGYIVWRKP